MNRRAFLKMLIGSVVSVPVAAAVGPSVGMTLWQKFTAWWNRKQAERTLYAALNSPEGRVALAQSMCEPIRRRLEYQAIYRKVMLPDPLPM